METWECDAEHCLVGWLAVWLTVSLPGWLVDWLVSWLAVAWLELVDLLIYAKPLQLTFASELDPGSMSG